MGGRVEDHTGVGAFNNKNVGTDKAVSITGLSIEGTDAGNYNFTTTASTTASISQKSLSATGITASDKTYDGNAIATLVYTGAGWSGLVTNDSVTLDHTGVGLSFAYVNKKSRR